MEAPRQAIAFGDVFVDNATRVDYSNANALQGFTVYGTVSSTLNGGGTVALFGGDGATVTRGTADYGQAWSYTETEHWIPGANYQFAAVVDATASVEGGLPTTLTTVADNDMNLKDMLYAVNSVTSAAADQGIVKFTFSHLLSKVKFTVTSTAQGNYYHNVTGIKVSNFETGTYTINGGTWAGDTAKDVEFANIEEVTSTDTNGLSNADMLLVPNAAKFNVTFTVELWNSKGTDDTADDIMYGTETKTIGVDTDLVKGNAYNFTIACAVGNAIQFSVNNDPAWGTQTDVAIP